MRPKNKLRCKRAVGFSPNLGITIHDAAREAIALARKKKRKVRFRFMELSFLVGPYSEIVCTLLRYFRLRKKQGQKVSVKDTYKHSARPATLRQACEAWGVVKVPTIH